MLCFISACSGQTVQDQDPEPAAQPYEQTTGETETVSETSDAEMISEYMHSLTLQKSYKIIGNHNPVMTQRFGADPYALVYDGRVYLYMTGDDVMLNADGTPRENDYSNIWTISVISSADLVNWTDHGMIYAASSSGQASWGNNSWAPAAAWKMVDGKPKFFLYFANNGNGIAVLTSDSPTGPFTDPLGGPLISRATPYCSDVTWLFDPAILMDEDGSAYIYFGGGIPSPDMADNPGTARVARLGDDMISLDTDPVTIANVPYLFEDSGINRIGDTYYYSYCSNFNVTSEAQSRLGFGGGEIVTMTSDSPMGPFALSGSILRNPGAYFGTGGNNHHCIFEFEGTWYITYHARLLEQAMDLDGGYRSTNIDVLLFDENGIPASSLGTQKGADQVGTFDPYAEVPAATFGNMAGLSTVQYGETAEKYGSGEMIVTDVADGSWICIYGADFGEAGPSEFSIEVRRIPDEADENAINAIRIVPDKMFGTDPVLDISLSEIMNSDAGSEFVRITVPVETCITGVHDIYMIFAGEGYEIRSWSFS
ncbi:MAG: family 43 glycosylhydrolase [Lachnospiraceae bacterium]|nr:family 43 glycosylhydrolase [Lachnospiraceae bacterium]